MAKIEIAKGEWLHRRGDTVESVDVILKGKIALKKGEDTIVCGDSGALLGAFHPFGGQYRYDYLAEENSTLFVYDYKSESDLLAAIKATPAIAPVMVSASLGLLNGLARNLSAYHEQGMKLCHDLKDDYADYRNVCSELMIAPQKFESVIALTPPEYPSLLAGWQLAFCRAALAQDEVLRKNCYASDINLCTGAIMLAAALARDLQPQIELAAAYIQKTLKDTDEFVQEYHFQKSKLDEAKRREARKAGSGQLPKITNALNTILAFAGGDGDIRDNFTRNVKRYMLCPDKTEKSAEMRRLRSDITQDFYTIYEAAFFKSLETEEIPPEVKMFFLFGFVDEELAGAENTAALYKFSLLWEPDPQGRVMTAYDWLRRVYRGEVPPSKDEFDNFWPDYLKEKVNQGAMTAEAAEAMLNDGKAMVSYEINNMIASANKMSSGSILSFVPIFSAPSAVKPLESCLATVERVTAALNRVRELDFGCFYRPAAVGYPELKIRRFEYDVEVLPYIILMPNLGSRGVMWQEIDTRRRTSPAHLVVSLLHSEELFDTVIKLCAQFRWEMCKRIQGIHYSDISEPSLTSEYCNYLQFYKKNHNLSPDMKEKVKAALKRHGNSYRNIFTAEYELYLKNESAGLPKLNKVARDILFRYCTFAKKYREALVQNPQYKILLERWKVMRETKEHTLDVFSRKILTMTDTLPEEVKLEAAYMKL
ncbi:MAG: cyclic nucleotide-binding domain-containing protein [Selenomonadaceae bacterium]|nr:cyclic nucleotide-binding domain-containing protein [Selenomonadaceae bacterium]